jgi:hypothetical protein
MKVLFATDHVIDGCTDLVAQSCGSLGASFQIGDTDHVVVRHRYRNPARGFDGQRMAAFGAVAARETGHAVKVFGAVGHVLPIDHAGQAFAEPVPCGTRELRANAR